MYTIQPKKLIIINILDILNKYSDENHKLTQKQIVDILHTEYNMSVDRKSVKRNLLNLLDFGYDIRHTELIRVNKNGNEETILTDWYIMREFTDAELRLIIDSLLFSRNISHTNKKEIIEKITGLSNKYFKSKVKHVSGVPPHKYGNKEMFYIIEILDEAISSNRQVKFLYNDIGTDKKMHPRRREDGTIREYIINPYQMAAVNGHYYLICNYDKYDGISNYRVDRISNIETISTPIKPIESLKDCKYRFDLPKYMLEHIYMYSGENIVVKFRTNKCILNEIYDWFGYDIRFSEETTDEVTVTATVNLEAMKRWALQYALCIKILSPQSLVEEVIENLRKAVEGYE